jgi:hypothetical protein
MNISSVSQAAAFHDGAAQKAVQQSRQARQEAAQRSVEVAQASKVQTQRAVRQASAAPSGENRISRDIRQVADAENRSEGLRRISEQMALKFREMARRSESARLVGNSEREGFSAVA